MNDRTTRVLIDEEFQRLGLNARDLPGLASGPGGAEGLLAHLRSLEAGVTWYEALPNLPKDWIPGRPETWIVPYRPYGAYDYQELPTGPAPILVMRNGREGLEAFVAKAKASGWPVYGAGFVTQDGYTDHAHIVMVRGTSEEEVNDFVSWAEGQADVVELAAIPRWGSERYRD